jgi:hypothetical protein
MTLALALVAVPGDVVRGQTVVFVDSDAVGAATGASWEDAWTDLQDALARAEPGDRIWVAAGHYSPGTLRNATFQLIDGVELYGGFAGVEDPLAFELAARDFAADETVLDGDITGSGGSGHVFHVVTGSGVASSAVLDGFTITGGRADGATALLQDVGGGMLIIDGSPTVRNCTLRSNESGSRGGAVHNFGGNATFVSCRFFANRTTVTQAANNLGGAFYSGGGPENPGGALLINCLFVANHAGVGAGGYGGGFYEDVHSLSRLVNCTFTQNRADTDGGGVFGAPSVTNSVLWANHDRRGTGRTSQIFGSAAVAYSCVQGGWAGTGNTSDDPLFVDSAGEDGIPGTVDDDLRLGPGSPCIDAGDNDTEAGLVEVDLAGEPRFVDDPVTPDSGNPPSDDAIVDMGAYEYQATCDSAADCDDGVFCNGSETCVGGECQAGDTPDCDDGVECTVDRCDLVADDCRHSTDDSRCDNGSVCDGIETCHASLGCQAGGPPDCDDGVPCTIDSCGAAPEACAHEPDDTLCDNGLACDGAETCDVALGCQVGTPVDCNDGVGCTVDACEEPAGTCSNTPDDAACNDALFCNGAETCDSDSGCVAGADPCPGHTCHEENDTCESSSGSCTADGDCDDGNLCTDDVCDGGDCVHIPNSASCDDGDPCSENDVCSSGSCVGTPIPDCDQTPPDETDTDGDGVIDENDQCAGTPDGEAVDSTGCSCSQRDDDGDGVDDYADECPTDPNKIVSGVCGCGIPDSDSDADGVPDCNDVCPDTAEGVAVDADGCPEEPPAEDPVPDPLDEPTSDESDLAPNGNEDPDGTDPLYGVATGQRCGMCGAFGLISGTMLWLGLLGLKTRPLRPRRSRRRRVTHSRRFDWLSGRD